MNMKGKKTITEPSTSRYKFRDKTVPVLPVVKCRRKTFFGTHTVFEL